MTLIRRLRSGIEKYFHRRSDWQPHEEFMVEFMREHCPYWSDEHGQNHYHFPYKPVLSGERMDKGSPDGLLVVTDGLQEEDIKRLKNG